MLSKQPLMSPSSIHCGESFRDRAFLTCSIASAVDLSWRKPYEFVSPIVSATGSSDSRCSACDARSFMVGMPKGRVPPLFFGMWILRSGNGLYFLFPRDAIAVNFASGVFQRTWSTPGVLCPLFSVTRRTARAFALVLCVSSRCRRLTCRHSPAFVAFAMRICSLPTTRCTSDQLMPCQCFHVSEATSH